MRAKSSKLTAWSWNTDKNCFQNRRWTGKIHSLDTPSKLSDLQWPQLIASSLEIMSPESGVQIDYHSQCLHHYALPTCCTAHHTISKNILQKNGQTQLYFIMHPQKPEGPMHCPGRGNARGALVQYNITTLQHWTLQHCNIITL